MNNTCPICFEDITEKSKATPDVCDHVFCLRCLEKWSKHGSYCPVDRKRFRKIINLASETVIQVKPCRPKLSRVQYDVTVFCEVCKKSNNARTLLLCDCCDLGYHCICLTPPLEEVPAGVWFCPVCVEVETRIKKAKDPNALQQENPDQHNQRDVLVASKTSRGNELTRIETCSRGSRGSINRQEQNIEEEIKDASLRKDYAHININERTKDTDRTSQINIARNETNICRGQELCNKKEIMSSKSLRRKDPNAKMFDVKGISLESQGSIERSAEDSNYKLRKSSSLYMGPKSRALSLNTNKTENDFSESNIEHNESMIYLNKDGFSQIVRRSNRLKNKYVPDISSTSLNNIASSKTFISLENQVKRGENNTLPLNPKRNLYTQRVDIKNNSNATKGFKHDSQDHSKNNSLKLRKKENQIIKGDVDIEDLSAFDANIASTSENVPSSKGNGNNYVFPNLRKIENQNSKECYCKRVDSGENFQVNSTANGTSKNIHYHQENNKNANGPQSLKTKESRNWKDVNEGTIYIEEEFPASQYYASEDLSQKNDRKYIFPPCLEIEENKNVKDISLSVQGNVPSNHYQASQTDIAISSTESVYNSPQKIAQRSIWNCDDRMYSDLYGEIGRDSLSATQPKIKRSSIVICSDQVFCNKNIMSPNVKIEDIRNSTDSDREIIGIRFNSSAIETNKKTGKSYSCQELYNNHSAPILMKSYNKRDFLEIKNASDDSRSFQSNISRNEEIIHCNQEEYINTNVGIKNISKKEVCLDNQDVSVEYKGMQNNFPARKSNISKSEDTTYNVQTEYDRKIVSRSFIELKNSLIEELESNKKADDDCCKSTNKTAVLIDQEFSKNKPNSFDTKKIISNFDAEDLSSLTSKKNAKKSKSKDVDKWYCMEKQGKAVCINQISGNCTQLEMNRENLHPVSSLRSALCVSPSNIKNFEFKNASVCNDDFVPTFNNSDKDRIAESSRFSVFEPLEDTFASSQKYLNMSMAVDKKSLNSREPLSLFSKSFSNPKKSEAILSPDNFLSKNQNPWEPLKKGDQNPFSSHHSREVQYAIEAKMNLTHELIKIEKEKWSRSWKKYKYSQMSRSGCPKKAQKNTFNVCEST